MSTTETVTSSVTSQIGLKEISSSAKSFPEVAVFWLTMQISAVVWPPAVQVSANSCQLHTLKGAVKILPKGTPLIENCNWAGLTGMMVPTQALNS